MFLFKVRKVPFHLQKQSLQDRIQYRPKVLERWRGAGCCQLRFKWNDVISLSNPQAAIPSNGPIKGNHLLLHLQHPHTHTTNGAGGRGRSVEPHVKSNMTIGWRIRTGTAQEHEDMSVTVFLMGGVPLHAPSIGLPLIGIQPSTHHPQPSTHPGNSTSAAVPALAHSSTRLPPSSQRSAACLPPGDDLLQKRTKMTSKASPV